MELPHRDIRSYSPLALAYIGDAVYDLLIRTEIVAKGNCQVNKYHRQVSEIVKAQAQSQLIQSLLDELTEEERDVYHRGRNANSYTKAKNASMGDYHRATGFEALIGYLYLTEQYARITELIRLGREKE
ncbi:MAG: ribonuclease III [Lachnospiraceae bacterium]|nr:ribonuclease III [Lachnospiraceae bacterium]MBP3505483.1 ribonuclease III [Lachnospiraceae bacterium]